MGRSSTAVRISLLLAVIFVTKVASWQQYATPIQWPQKQDTPFVFDMDIRWKLTMAYQVEYGLMELVDYFPDDVVAGTNCSQGNRRCAWWLRNKDQLMACGLKDPLPHERHLDSVIQMHGLHQRVVTINGYRLVANFLMIKTHSIKKNCLRRKRGYPLLVITYPFCLSYRNL